VIRTENLLNTISTQVQAVALSNIGSASDVNLRFTNIPNVVKNGIQILVGVAGVIFFVMLVIGGIQYAMSGGDKAQAQAAKDRITNALIGIIIVAVAFALVSLISAILGVQITSVNVPNAR